MAVVEVETDRQWRAGRDVDVPDPSTEDRLDLEPEVGGTKGIELDQGVAQLGTGCLADRCNLLGHAKTSMLQR